MKKLLGCFLCVMLLGFFAAPAAAYPTLQLDILGGSYDTTTESTIGGASGTLVALLNPDKDDLLGGTYYISLAVVPITTTDPGSLGTFSIDSGATDLVHTGLGVSGNPLPLGQPHGVFDTWYEEYSFKFDGTQVGAYNVQDDAGDPPSGSDFYAAYFDYDFTSLIADGYKIHFDLYNTETREFAPFSHDATAAPEPATMLLLGSGLLGLGVFGRKKKK